MSSIVVDWPVIKDLVLVGGGHSHVAVLRSFGMKPIPGLRVTLVSRNFDTPYSGMLPGVVAGHYLPSEAHIDLLALCQRSGVRFVQAEVNGIDLDHREIQFGDRPPLPYDLLSVNIGSTPSVQIEVAQSPHVSSILTKPIDQFLAKWDQLMVQLESLGQESKLLIVGGGAAGVELALAIRYRLRMMAVPPRIHIVTSTTDILPDHNERVRQIMRAKLASFDIAVTTGTRLHGNPETGLYDEAGIRYACNGVIWATSAAAAPWVRATGIATDEKGFIKVNAFLQSVSHADLFAAGDIASREDAPRPKAGVFAVRQGLPLANNLRRHALGKSLQSFQPQRKYLSLISTGPKHAVASRGRWALAGNSIWRIKNWIDRRFIERYSP